ncbi:hypothetical protein V6N12_048554 [Hibiscus sabdariffa]|uniref:Epoxide hydrolase n=1 Tax=Hibiscus sabdariffa TaxID=183260 RepID=A0ABR2EJC5_9ROSI
MKNLKENESEETEEDEEENVVHHYEKLGPKVVLFLHGFPEIWYTWERHHMAAVANAGFELLLLIAGAMDCRTTPSELEIQTRF